MTDSLISRLTDRELRLLRTLWCQCGEMTVSGKPLAKPCLACRAADALEAKEREYEREHRMNSTLIQDNSTLRAVKQDQRAQIERLTRERDELLKAQEIRASAIRRLRAELKTLITKAEAAHTCAIPECEACMDLECAVRQSRAALGEK